MNHTDFMNALRKASELDCESGQEVPWNEIKCMQDYIRDLEIGQRILKICCGVLAVGIVLILISVYSI